MQYTNITQSKRLVELGLSPQTSDMHWWTDGEKEYQVGLGGYNKKEKKIMDEYGSDYLPCWSLDTLLKILPIPYQMTRNRDGKVQLMLITVQRKDYFESELEAAYSMLIWLLENDLFDEEKLINYGSQH